MATLFFYTIIALSGRGDGAYDWRPMATYTSMAKCEEAVRLLAATNRARCTPQ